MLEEVLDVWFTHTHVVGVPKDQRTLAFGFHGCHRKVDECNETGLHSVIIISIFTAVVLYKSDSFFFLRTAEK